MGAVRYDEVIERFGTQVRLAAALGITQSTVSSWKGTVPPRYQFQLEVLTRGDLKADAHLLAQSVPAAQQAAWHPRKGQLG